MVATGRLRLPDPVEQCCTSRARAAGMRLLDVRFIHVYEASRLPLHHRDPLDRMLVAQARIEQVAVLTADESFGAYDVEVETG